VAGVLWLCGCGRVAESFSSSKRCHNVIFEFFAAMSEESCYYCGGPSSVCAAGEDSRHKFTMVLDDRFSSRAVFSSIL